VTGSTRPGARDEALQGALRERLLHLPMRERKVLLHAAAIGRRFDVTLLAAIMGRTPAQILPSLESACALQILEPVDDTRARYRFRHALIREAMYDELVAHRLRRLHRHIGENLERLSPACATTIQELAYHFWAAGDRKRGCRYERRSRG